MLRWLLTPRRRYLLRRDLDRGCRLGVALLGIWAVWPVAGGYLLAGVANPASPGRFPKPADRDCDDLNLLTRTGTGSDALPLATRSARFCTRSKRRSVRREALTYF
jgi:hypothetical protein